MIKKMNPDWLTIITIIIIILGLGRIAGILSLEVEDETVSLDAVKHVGSELAMHVVAAKPVVLTKELVSSDALQNEREILKSQVISRFIYHTCCLYA